MSNTIIISGSHGELRVHRETGVVVERLKPCYCGECRDGYGDIVLFNPVDIRREERCNVLDILWVGYWDDEGRYEPALTHRTIWRDGWNEDFDEAVPMALLPAPAGP